MYNRKFPDLQRKVQIQTKNRHLKKWPAKSHRGFYEITA